MQTNATGSSVHRVNPRRATAGKLLLAAVSLAAPAAQGQISSGLTAYWNFNNNLTDQAALLTFASSTVADDAVFTNAPEAGYGTGLFGQGYAGTGVEGYAAVPVSEDISGVATGNHTVAFWFQAQAPTSTWQAAVALGEGSAWRVARAGGDNPLRMSYAGGTGDIYATTFFGAPDEPLAEWHHVAAVTEGGVSTRLYYDGVLEATGGVPALAEAGAELWIGGNPQAAGRSWNGFLDDMGIWNRPLTAAEIARIFTAGKTSAKSLGDVITDERLDADADGLPDFWETANLPAGAQADNGSVNPAFGPAGDPDGDLSTNLNEYGKGTKPQDDDTDDDGLKDGAESGTGIYASPANTGTDPLNPDTDGDTLLDGTEKAELANGSNPNLRDTDGDFFPDAAEVAAASNPKDPLSTPGGIKLEVLGVGAEFLLGNDATDPENDVDDSGGGEGTGGNWVAVTSESGAPITFDGEGALNVFDNKLGGGVDKWCCGGAPQDLTVEFPAPLALTHFTVSSANDTPTRDPLEWGISGSNDGVNFTSIAAFSTPGLWTERLQVVKFTLGAAAPQYKFIRYSVDVQSGDALHQIGEIEYFGTSTDTDGDGMPDGYEETNGLDKNSAADKTTDKDGDLLANFEEFRRGTNPQKADSDDDSLADRVETKTGIWVSSDDTGTNPLKPDTDGDGLTDGVENPDKPFTGPAQTGSDPNKTDTDSDFFSDSAEVAANSDPDSAAATPGGQKIEVLGTGAEFLLGGDLTDPENDLDDSGGGEGAGGNWVAVTSESGAPITFDGEGALNVFDNKLGGGVDKWCCGGAPQDLTVEFAAPVALTHFTISSGNDTPTRDPNIWGIYGSNDGVTFTPIAQYSGTRTLWTERLQVVRFTLGAPAPAYKHIRYQVDEQSGDALHQIGEIEYFAGGGGGPVSGFAITGISRNPADGAVTLTWASTPGKTYTIKHSADLTGAPADLGAVLPAAAAPATTTSHTFPNPNPAAPRLFFRVQEQL